MEQYRSDSRDLGGPSQNMKQARLPFQSLGQQGVSQTAQVIVKDNKKRKLSDPESPAAKASKPVKADLLTSSNVENENEVTSSSETADLNACLISVQRPAKTNTLERYVKVVSVCNDDDISSTKDDEHLIDLTDEFEDDVGDDVLSDEGKENVDSVKSKQHTKSGAKRKLKASDKASEINVDNTPLTCASGHEENCDRLSSDNDKVEDDKKKDTECSKYVFSRIKKVGESAESNPSICIHSNIEPCDIKSTDVPLSDLEAVPKNPAAGTMDIRSLFSQVTKKLKDKPIAGENMSRLSKAVISNDSDTRIGRPIDINHESPSVDVSKNGCLKACSVRLSKLPSKNILPVCQNSSLSLQNSMNTDLPVCKALHSERATGDTQNTCTKLSNTDVDTVSQTSNTIHATATGEQNSQREVVLRHNEPSCDGPSSDKLSMDVDEHDSSLNASAEMEASSGKNNVPSVIITPVKAIQAAGSCGSIVHTSTPGMNCAAPFMSPQQANMLSTTMTTSPGSVSESTPKSVTPKTKLSSAKKLERDTLRKKVKDEKERVRLGKKQQLEDVKAEKEQQRLDEKKRKDAEREAQRIAKEKDLEEKRELKELERLEKEREKQEKEQVREDEKRKKQEQVDAKQEEKRKKDEERQKEDDEKIRKKQAVRNKFASFFTKSEKTSPPQKPQKSTGSMFMPFEVKKDMHLAPVTRDELNSERREVFEDSHQAQDSSERLYVQLLTSHAITPTVCTAKSKCLPDDDVLVIGHDSETVKKVTHHAKLLQFKENNRPAYYGTWRRSSAVLSARNPFKMDTSLFDYDVDSDDEWEEEEPGESLSDSEGEEDKEEKEEKDDDEEDEDGWMVPHGYLSGDEGCEDEDEEVTPETLKARQALSQAAWDRELKRQCQPVMPVIIGCYWVAMDNAKKIDLVEKLHDFQACMLIDLPIATTHSRAVNASTDDANESDSEKTGQNSGNKGSQKKTVPEEAMPDLVRLVHGNVNGIKKLGAEFRMFWKRKLNNCTPSSLDKETDERDDMDVDDLDDKLELSQSFIEEQASQDDNSDKAKVEENSEANISGTNDTKDEKEDEFTISKRQMEMKISAIAVKEKRSAYKRICWYVHESILAQYGLEDLPVPHPACVKIDIKKEVPVLNALSTSPQSASVAKAVEEKLQATPKRAKDQMSLVESFTKKVSKSIDGIPCNSSVNNNNNNNNNAVKSINLGHIDDEKSNSSDCQIIATAPATPVDVHNVSVHEVLSTNTTVKNEVPKESIENTIITKPILPPNQKTLVNFILLNKKTEPVLSSGPISCNSQLLGRTVEASHESISVVAAHANTAAPISDTCKESIELVGTFEKMDTTEEIKILSCDLTTMDSHATVETMDTNCCIDDNDKQASPILQGNNTEKVVTPSSDLSPMIILID